MNSATLIRLAKKFLLPRAKQWWRERKARKAQEQQQQQQQQGGGGGGYQQQQYSQQHAPQGASGYNQYQQPPPQQQYGSSPGNYNNNQPSYAAVGAGGAGAGGAAAGFYGGGGQQAHQQQPQQHYGGGYNAGYQGQQQQHTYRPPQHTNTDMQHASDPSYVQLRNQALQADSAMHRAFDAASRAHDAGDGAGAKQLSNEGHAHQAERDRLNDQAADWIFRENNKEQPRGSIDLHGLYVQEAIEKTEQAVRDGQSQGLQELRIITGKGIHSNQGVAKIKPAIEKLMVKYQLSAHLDPRNSGVLIVNLQGSGGGSRDLGWVDQADRESDDGQCIIS